MHRTPRSVPDVHKSSKRKPLSASATKTQVSTAEALQHVDGGLRLPHPLWIILLLNALVLAPLLWSGYSSDDLVSAQIRGILIQNKMDIWQFTVTTILAWVRNLGRVFPLALMCYPFFYYCQNLVAYKCLVLVVVLADITVFYLLIKRASQSTALALVSSAILPLFIQFRGTWDPVLSFSCLYPLLTLFFFGSLLLFVRHVERPSVHYLGSSLFLFTLSALIFEFPLLLSVVYIIIPWQRRKSLKEGLRTAAPFLAMDALLISATLYFRSRALGLAQSPYAIHLAPAAVLKALIAQYAGLVPLLYSFLDPSGMIRAAAENNFWIRPASLAVFLSALILLWMLCRAKGRNPATGGRSGVLLTALVFVVVPLFLVSLSSKYQRMSVADSHLAVYLSSFGASILAAAGILRFWRRLIVRRTSWLTFAALGIGSVAYAWNFRSNALVVSFLNRTDMGLTVARKAAQAGFFDNLPEDGVILNVPARPWELNIFFAEASRHRQTLLSLQENRDYGPILISAGANCSHEATYDVCAMPPNGKVFFFHLQFPTPGSTALILSRLSSVVLERGAIRALLSTDTDLFFSSPHGGYPPAAPAVRGRYADWRDTDLEPDAFWASRGELKLKSDTPGGQWFHMRTRSLEATSLKVYDETPETPGLSPIAKPSSPAEFHLTSTQPPLIHTGYTLKTWSEGIVLESVPLKPPLSVELVVVPESTQFPYATILSNHGNAFGGLSIEQEGASNNRYAVFLGTGSTYQLGREFNLPALRRHYIAIEIQRETVAVYVDGASQATSVRSSDLAESGLPFRLGNWAGGGRSFSGHVEELLVAPEVLSPAEILARANALGIAREK